MMNEVIGRLPLNAGVHWSANQWTPVANTMTSMGGSGTSVKLRKEEVCHTAIEWQP